MFLTVYFDKINVPNRVWYSVNGEIGIGVMLTVDVETMCNQSPTFKNAYDKANATYKTVFYQWYKNGEKINGATGVSYTVKTTDKNSKIHCVVTLVDGKFGIGEQFEISNVITVININMPRPKDGQTRIEKTEIFADGVDIVGIMWWPLETGAEMQGSDVYEEGVMYMFYLQVQAKDTFLLDFNGDMTIAYAYGEECLDAGSIPNQGKAYYSMEVMAIHNHQYLDSVWAYDEWAHWQPCIVPGCIDPNEEWVMYTPHQGGNATCISTGICVVCGAEYMGEHDFSVPDYEYFDEHKCVSYCTTEGCNEYGNEWSYHTGGVADCQHKAVCEICHHEYGNTLPHTPKGEWVNDENEHWHECSDCNEQLDKFAHADENADCKCDECGYEMNITSSEKDSTTPPQSDGKGLGVGAIIGITVGGAIVVGGGGFAIFWFIIKKRKIKP